MGGPPATAAVDEPCGRGGVGRVHETGFFPADQAVSVRTGDDGTPVTTPGSQAAEPISGYYTIDVTDLQEAVSWAARVPVAGKGTVEVRQVVELDP